MILSMKKRISLPQFKPQQLLKKLISRRFRKREIFLLFIILFIAGVVYFLKDLPLPTKLSSPNNPQSTLIYDRNGKLLYNIYDKKNQTFIPLSTIPKYMQEATIAIEDKNFYQHGAIDLRGITRAFISIVFHQRVQGGSSAATPAHPWSTAKVSWWA